MQTNPNTAHYCINADKLSKELKDLVSKHILTNTHYADCLLLWILVQQLFDAVNKLAHEAKDQDLLQLIIPTMQTAAEAMSPVARQACDTIQDAYKNASIKGPHENHQDPSRN